MFTSRNLQAQGPVKPTGCKDAALSLPTPALGIGPQPLCSLGTKIPIPPLPSLPPSPVIDFPESLDAEPETVSHRKAADRVN